MAKAHPYTKQIPVTALRTERMVRLDLSLREAESLGIVLAMIGGNELLTRRGDTQAVLNAIESAGVNIPVGACRAYFEPNTTICGERVSTGMHFKEGA
jgi:hypothetical protein